MPILASRGQEIRRLISELADPGTRVRARLRLKTLGARVVPHVDEELGRLDLETRRALADALAGVDTADGRALRERLARVDSAASAGEPPNPQEGAESEGLKALRALPPPRPGERASISRSRGEAHLTLASAGSRLARKDLVHSLDVLPPDRARLYCEAASLIGDAAFIPSLARLGSGLSEARAAIAAIVTREKITKRSKVFRELDPSGRAVFEEASAKVREKPERSARNG